MNDSAAQPPGKEERLNPWKAGCLVAGGLFVLWFGSNILLAWFHPGPRIVCHIALDSSLSQWQLETTNTGYPNVRGESLASINALPSSPGFYRDYRYVAGVQPGDPSNLVLFYADGPSRQYWHGQGWSLWREKKWVVLVPNFAERGSQSLYERAETLTTTEFSNRLAATLDYLERNQRPYWTNTVREHLAFLNSLR